MVNRLELEKILKQNPHIDIELLKQAIDLMQRLEELGVRKSGYSLASPYARRRTAGTNSKADSASIWVKRA